MHRIERNGGHCGTYEHTASGCAIFAMIYVLSCFRPQDFKQVSMRNDILVGVEAHGSASAAALRIISAVEV